MITLQQEDGWIDAYTPKCIDNECFMIANYGGWKSLISFSGTDSNSTVYLKSNPRQTVTGLYGVSASKELYTLLMFIFYINMFFI